jgi:hypothetical protein
MSSLDEIRMENGKLPASAWPGGYPIVYVMDDGEILCADCANDPTNPVHEGGDADGWRLEGYSLHLEGSPEHCAHCNKAIASAYGDPDEDAPRAKRIK